MKAMKVIYTMIKLATVAIAILTVMSLVSCSKDEPTTTVAPTTIAEDRIYESTIEEEVIEETIIEETMHDSEGYELSLTREECSDLYERYRDGLISEEYYAEVLYNSRVG